ncbi:preprotein translocase SecA [Asanoa ishikariensis]|uniref:SEC-C motif-containing protein n=1 Tax=Asanoa ishikariensis TaxID=137265 RepID=A0A1H3L1R0_9ACTN|nr:SEC-C domain-containing protein [Asanoa ishikariensis]GIF69559.1 preprotein translocase SecA [Asanoa ishikariensis]SDY58280.1 SEC-C motif-containing protein [Asanoa ishikariensis]
MLTRDVLTSADLEELRRTALGTADPLGVAADLALAVEERRLADQEDAGFALTLAAEIAEVRARLDAALSYADRAVAAYPEDDAPGAAFARALRARILFRVGGHDDEALAVVTELRPLLTEQPDAPAYVSAALEAGGRTAVAEEWLSSAAESLIAARGEPASLASDEAPGVLFFLLQQRHRVRRDLNLAHDKQDDLADRLEAQLSRRAAEPQSAEADLVFFAQPEFDRLLESVPALAEVYGPDWDGHRARLEKHLVRQADAGGAGLSVIRASADGLAGFARQHGGEPTDAEIRSRYATELAAQPGAHIPWPPARNEVCWCGSGLKYKKDCLPRSR